MYSCYPSIIVPNFAEISLHDKREVAKGKKEEILHCTRQLTVTVLHAKYSCTICGMLNVCYKNNTTKRLIADPKNALAFTLLCKYINPLRILWFIYIEVGLYLMAHVTQT